MKLAEALYTLNKTAKTYRDVRNDLKKVLFDQDSEIAETSIEFISKMGIDFNLLFSVSDMFRGEYFSKQMILEGISEVEADINWLEEEINDSDEEEQIIRKKLTGELELTLDECQEYLENLDQIYDDFTNNQNNAHELLHDLRDQQNDIYDLKEKTLFILDLPADAYHDVNGEIMKLVHYDGFSFHTYLSEDEEMLYKEGKCEISKSIEELIPAKSCDENELGEAIKTVKAFIKQNEEKLDDFEPHHSSYSYYSSYSSRSSHSSYSYSDYDEYDYDYDNYPEYYDNDEDDDY